MSGSLLCVLEVVVPERVEVLAGLVAIHFAFDDITAHETGGHTLEMRSAIEIGIKTDQRISTLGRRNVLIGIIEIQEELLVQLQDLLEIRAVEPENDNT